MNLKRNFQLALIVIFLECISSCGSGKKHNPSSDPQPQPSKTILEMTAPLQYPAGIASIIPVVMTNNSNIILQGITYNIDSNNTTGAEITIDKILAQNCASLAIAQSCTLLVNVPSTTHSGVFSVYATINQPSLQNKLNSTSIFQQSATVGLINLSNNIDSNANGVSLMYPSTIAPTNASNITQVIVVAVVGSNVGNFNDLNLVDSNGNPLQFSVLSGNIGAGMTNLVAGSVVVLLVTVPNGTSQLQFAIQTLNTPADAPSQIISTSNNLQVMNVINSVSNNTGVLTVLPNYIDLNDSYNSQVITLLNTGSGDISNILATTTGNNLIIGSNTCGNTLAVGNTCQYSVAFAQQAITGGTDSIQFSYNNGNNNVTTTATVNYQGASTVGGLMISNSSGNANFDFITTTNNPSESTLVTLTNIGKTPITNIRSNIAAPFSISATGRIGSCAIGEATTLATNSSCQLILTYNNSVVSNIATTSKISITYNYQDANGNLELNSNSISATYQTVQSSAILGISSPSFSTIANNGLETQVATVKISNLGDDQATNLAYNIDNPNLFHLVSGGTCSTTLLPGAVCTQNIQFGPFSETPISISNQSALFSTSYNTSTVSTSNVASSIIPLTGKIITQQSAQISVDIISSSGWVTGDGSSNHYFKVQQNTISFPTVTFKINNTGSVPANNFALSGYTDTSLLPWSIQNNCTAVVASGNSCTVTFSLNPNTIGSQNLDLSSIQMNWIDQDSPNGQTQQFSSNLASNLIYTSVFQAPIITTTNNLNLLTVLSRDQTFNVTATLSGGYNISNQLITMIIANDPNQYVAVTSNPNPCTISNQQPVCSFSATVDSLANAETNIVFSLVNFGIIPIANNALTLDIVAANHYFYTLNEGYISMFKLDIASGSISSLAPATVGAIRNPLNMVISPNSKFIYELSETYSNNKISIYNVDLATGQLTATGLPSATKESVNSMVFTPDGHYAYLANRGKLSKTATISMYSVDSSTGQLTSLNPAKIETKNTPYTLLITPDGRFIYSLSSDILGSSVNLYGVNEHTGQLSLLTTKSVNNIIVDGKMSLDGHYLYVINGDIINGDIISIYKIDQNSGELINTNQLCTRLYQSKLAFSIDGRYAYVASYGKILIYEVDVDTGNLSPIKSNKAITLAQVPEVLVADPSGSFIFSSYQDLNSISLFNINNSTGGLLPVSYEAAKTSSKSYAIVFSK